MKNKNPNQIISITIPPKLLLDVDTKRFRLMKRNPGSFLARSVVVREALQLWLEHQKEVVESANIPAEA